MNRRTFLKTATACGLGAALPLPLLGRAAADSAPVTLRAVRRSLDIDGRAATVLGLERADGGAGLVVDAGSRFAVTLTNEVGEPTLVHWHGLAAPWEQDGVPDVPKPLLTPGESRAYDFPVGEGGTHWMHAHTLQEQRLLAAPLIVRREAERRADVQEVTVLLHDFSFRAPEDLLADLRRPGAGGHGDMAGMNGHGGMGGMDMSGTTGMDHGAMHGAMSGGGMAGMGMSGGAMAGHDGHAMAGGGMDLNDIDYDAYLANDRTLADPQVTTVERGGRVRLRLIDGASATAFTIDTGALAAELIEVDGRPVAPVGGRRFPITMGQRLDLLLTIPKEGGVFPILALREGAVERTGIVLATAGAAVKRIEAVGTTRAPVLDLDLESRLRAASPLTARPADRSHTVDLTGTMAGYRWSMSSTSLRAVTGERIEITLVNRSMMAHPMHLHGHHFQVVAIDGTRFSGAMRDTVLVPPMRSVTIAFDADNPGRWAFHCHHLYHMATGMMGFVAYDGVG